MGAAFYSILLCISEKVLLSTKMILALCLSLWFEKLFFRLN